MSSLIYLTSIYWVNRCFRYSRYRSEQTILNPCPVEFRFIFVERKRILKCPLLIHPSILPSIQLFWIVTHDDDRRIWHWIIRQRVKISSTRVGNCKRHIRNISLGVTWKWWINCSEAKWNRKPARRCTVFHPVCTLLHCTCALEHWLAQSVCIRRPPCPVTFCWV